MNSNDNKIDLVTLLPLIREITASGGEFRLLPQGVSMLPTLRSGRDAVMLCRATPPFSRGDILLFRRVSGAPVLHRVVKVKKDGSLIMRGDAQYYTETITEEQVIAMVKRYFRDEKEIFTHARTTRLRTWFRLTCYPVRHFFVRVKSKISRKGKGKDHG